MSNLSDKLDYLEESKNRLYSGMIANGYDVTNDMPLRDVVNLLYQKVIEEQVEEMDIDMTTIPEYWEQEVIGAVAHVLTLGDSYKHYIVSTDNHYDLNYKKSAPIMKILYDTGLFNKVINLGDITDSHTETQIANVMSDFKDNFGEDLIFAIGNHDSDVASFLPLLEDNQDIQSSGTKFETELVYYVDDKDAKIRFIVMGGNTGDTVNANSYYFPWINAMPEGWSAVTLAHYSVMSFISDFSGTEQTTNPVKSIGVGYLLAHVMASGKNYIGHLCGHDHSEAISNYLGYDVCHQAVLCNDGNANDPVPWHKTSGTTSENAITIFSVNTTLRDVKFYKVGQIQRLGRRFGWKYRNVVPVDKIGLIQGRFLTTSNGIASDSNDYFMFNCILERFDEQSKPIRHFVIYDGDLEFIWEYAYLYTSTGGYVGRPSATAVNIRLRFAKIYCLDVSLNNPTRYDLSSGSKYLSCFQMSGTTASVEDFELATTLEDRDLGYDLEEVPWVANRWYSGGNQEPNNLMGSDLIHVEPNTEYRISVNVSGWTTNKTGIICRNGNLDLLQNTYSSNTISSITVTTPANTRYMQICMNNLVGNTDKVQLEKIS